MPCGVQSRAAFFCSKNKMFSFESSGNLKNMFWQFFRYGVASIFSYTIIFGGSYLLTDVMGLPANLSYFISISISYIFLFVVGPAHIFRVRTDDNRVGYFLLHIIIFWIMNNLVFNVIFYNIKIHYLLIIIINIAIFAPLRFLSLRHFVWVAKGIEGNTKV